MPELTRKDTLEHTIQEIRQGRTDGSTPGSGEIGEVIEAEITTHYTVTNPPDDPAVLYLVPNLSITVPPGVWRLEAVGTLSVKANSNGGLVAGMVGIKNITDNVIEEGTIPTIALFQSTYFNSGAFALSKIINLTTNKTYQVYITNDSAGTTAAAITIRGEAPRNDGYHTRSLIRATRIA